MSDSKIFPSLNDLLTIDQPLTDLPAFDIFNKLNRIALNYKWDGEELCHQNSNRIEFKNFSLLLAWPGILALEIAALTGNKQYKEHLASLRNLLNSDAQYTDIRLFLDKLLIFRPIPKEILEELKNTKINGDSDKIVYLREKLGDFQPELFKTLALLFDPKFIKKDHKHILLFIKLFLGNYYIICLMIAQYLKEDTNEAYIAFESIEEILSECGMKDQLDIYSLSQLWFHAWNSISNDALMNFDYAKKSKGLKFLIKEIMDVPKSQLKLEKMWLGDDNIENFAWINNYETSMREIVGLAHNFNPNTLFNYELWYMVSWEIINGKESINRSFLFVGDEKSKDKTLQNLFIQLYKLVKHSSILTKSLLESWNGFIDDDVEEAIGSNLFEFNEWIFPLLESYEMRNQLFSFKSLSRLIENLHNELDYKIIEEACTDFKEAKRYHIQPDLLNKLLAADKELRVFINLIISEIKKGKNRLGDQDKLLRFFDNHKDEYKYLYLLEHKDIKNINFSNDRNDYKKNRRNVLPTFYKKMGGKHNISGSTLAVLIQKASPHDLKRNKFFKYAKYQNKFQ